MSLFLCICLISCSNTAHRINQACEKVTQAGFQQEIIAKPLPIVTFSRITKVGKPVNVYIEGDGFAWVDRYTPSANPTPKGAGALQLAMQDRAANVIYLARPYQYLPGNHSRQQRYWTQSRFASEVVASSNAALRQIFHKYDIAKASIIGYSGGANIAAILAAELSEINLLVTVAGNLDHAAWTKFHNLTPLSDSLSAMDYINKLHKIRQVHFIGDQDNIVPKQVIEKYREQLSDAKFIVVTNQDHYNWYHRWPQLLMQLQTV